VFDKFDRHGRGAIAYGKIIAFIFSALPEIQVFTLYPVTKPMCIVSTVPA
jgi:hypothetical protein